MWTLLGIALATDGQIPIAGALTDTNGAPLQGTQSVTFSLSTSDSAAGEWWTGTVDVTCVDGAFQAILGAPGGAALNLDNFGTGATWLSVTHAGASSAWVPVGRAPLAVWADRAGSASQLGTLTPSDVLTTTTPIPWTQISAATRPAPYSAGFTCPAGQLLSWSGSAVVCAADTVGALSCAPGQVPVRGASSWTCGTAGIDTSAVQGQITSTLSAGNLAIGGASPHASAALDISSTTRGLLMPRLTGAQRNAIASPAAGLMIYNTDAQRPEYYNTSWHGVGELTPAPSTTSLNLMPVRPTEYFEFFERQNTATSTWDLTGTYTSQVVNGGMTWTAGEKAWTSSANLSKYIDTGWKPTAGNKTACMWRKLYGATVQGNDGYQQNPGYFYYGSYGSGSTGWYFYSGSNGGFASLTTTAATPPLNRWVFYCLASTGHQGVTAFYTAVPGDAGPVMRASQENGNDVSHAGDALGMVYGRYSSTATDGLSTAHYGSMIHWDAYLTADQVDDVYRATRKYYPGHGGTR